MIAFFKSFLSLLVTGVTMLEALIGLPVNSVVFNFEVPASVYESGDDMYTVIWTTNKRGTGSVSYTYEGKEYTVNDQVGGNIRCTDTIHSVRVPKKHLDNNTYTYSSQYVGFKGGYIAAKGKTITSDPIKFKGYKGQSAVKMLVLSDIHENMEPVRKAVKYFGDSYDIVVLNGDIVSTMEKKSSFVEILKYANELSNGTLPVVYVRGNHEPRGEYASEFMTYFKTTTGNLYFTFTYGPIWSLVLDCGEDKPDTHEEYSGLVDFNSYIAEESKWLGNLEPNGSKSIYYRLAMTHNPDFENEYGNDWTKDLERLYLNACISGHWHCLDLNFRSGTTSFDRLITGGKSDEVEYIATMMTFEKGLIKVESRDASGELAGERILGQDK